MLLRSDTVETTLNHFYVTHPSPTHPYLSPHCHSVSQKLMMMTSDLHHTDITVTTVVTITSVTITSCLSDLLI